MKKERVAEALSVLLAVSGMLLIAWWLLLGLTQWLGGAGGSPAEMVRISSCCSMRGRELSSFATESQVPESSIIIANRSPSTVMRLSSTLQPQSRMDLTNDSRVPARLGPRAVMAR